MNKKRLNKILLSTSILGASLGGGLLINNNSFSNVSNEVELEDTELNSISGEGEKELSGNSFFYTNKQQKAIIYHCDGCGRDLYSKPSTELPIGQISERYPILLTQTGQILNNSLKNFPETIQKKLTSWISLRKITVSKNFSNTLEENLWLKNQINFSSFSKQLNQQKLTDAYLLEETTNENFILEYNNTTKIFTLKVKLNVSDKYKNNIYAEKYHVINQVTGYSHITHTNDYKNIKNEKIGDIYPENQEIEITFGVNFFYNGKQDYINKLTKYLTDNSKDGWNYHLQTESQKITYQKPLENMLYDYQTKLQENNIDIKTNTITKESLPFFLEAFSLTQKQFINIMFPNETYYEYEDITENSQSSFWDVVGKIVFENIRVIDEKYNPIGSHTTNFSVILYPNNGYDNTPNITSSRMWIPEKNNNQFWNQQRTEVFNLLNFNSTQIMYNIPNDIFEQIKFTTENGVQTSNLLTTNQLKVIIKNINIDDKKWEIEFKENVDGTIIVYNKDLHYIATLSDICIKNFALGQLTLFYNFEIRSKINFDENNLYNFTSQNLVYYIDSSNKVLPQRENRNIYKESINHAGDNDTGVWLLQKDINQEKAITFFEINKDNFWDFFKKSSGLLKSDYFITNTPTIDIQYDYINKQALCTATYPNGFKVQTIVKEIMGYGGFIDGDKKIQTLKDKIQNIINNIDLSQYNINSFNSSKLTNQILSSIQTDLPNNIKLELNVVKNNMTENKNPTTKSIENNGVFGDITDLSDDVYSKNMDFVLEVGIINQNDEKLKDTPFTKFTVTKENGYTFENTKLNEFNQKLNDSIFKTNLTTDNAIITTETLQNWVNKNDVNTFLKQVYNLDLESFKFTNNYETKITSKLDKDNIGFDIEFLDKDNQTITKKGFYINPQQTTNNQELLDVFVNQKEELINSGIGVYESFTNGSYENGVYNFNFKGNKILVGIDTTNDNDFNVTYQIGNNTTTKSYSQSAINQNLNNKNNSNNQNLYMYIGIGVGIGLLGILVLILVLRKKNKNSLKRLANKEIKEL